MKYILSIFLVAACVITSCTQSEPSSFRIKGTLEPATKADSVLLFSYAGGKFIARAPVMDGKFELTGSIAEPQITVLLHKTKETEEGREKRLGELFLENADYTVEQQGADAKIKGGELHDKVLGFESSDEFIKAVNEYFAAEDSVYKGKDDFYEPTPEESNRIKEKEDVAIDIKIKHFESVLDDPKAPILAKVVALGDSRGRGGVYSFEKCIELFNAYEKELGHPSLELNRQRDMFNEFIKGEEKAATFAQGKMFKDIETKDTKGNTIKLSEVVAKNKFTILEFWASWCSPCRAEIPNLKKAYVKYKGKGLEIYSVSIDEKQADWLKALEEENTTWIQVLDNEKAVKDYGIQGVPTSFLIGQDGKIVEVSENLRGKKLDRALGKHMP